MSFVCENCLLDDEYLESFVNTKGSLNNECDYCKNADSKKISLEELSNYIVECLKDSYDLKSTASPEYESILDFMEDHFPVTNDELFDQTYILVAKKTNDAYLVAKEHDLMEKWKRFSKDAEEDSRFFFSKQNKDLLYNIMKLIKSHKLIRVIKPPFDKIFRARAFTEGNRFINDLRRMGPPKVEDVQGVSNRMSPPGIPILYASSSKWVARSEISITGVNRKAYISQFRVLRDITVIDFTHEEDSIIHIFNMNRERRNRGGIEFIRSFSDKLSQPIQKDGREHTKYTPTQILSQYIKKQGIKGIIYKSDGYPNGKNMALFFSQKNISEDENTNNKEVYLQFIKNKSTYKLPFEYDEKHRYVAEDNFFFEEYPRSFKIKNIS